MSERLCSKCRTLGFCQFEKEANFIAKTIPLSTSEEEVETNALETHKAIALLREIARNEYRCPEVNDVNPEYLGSKKSL